MRLFGIEISFGKQAAAPPALQSATQDLRETMKSPRQRLRRWEGAETDRLNEAHWAKALGDTLNNELAGNLATLRNRSENEIASNPIIEGVVETYITDVVGQAGPILEVQSSNMKYNDALERVWREWWAMPDLAEVLSGPELLKLCVRGGWTAGEFLIQLVQARNPAGPVGLRLKSLHPRRLETPYELASNDYVVMGVQVNEKTGKPTIYHILKTETFGDFSYLSTDADPIKSENIIHYFEAQEAEQVRGIPWLAPVLQVAADIRDYDAQVLDAARSAAIYGVVLWTDNIEAGFQPAAGSVDIERRVITTAPAGWKPSQMEPHQPAAQYIDYRHERIREFGRVRGMPFNMVLLDSRRHTYSTARFDGAVYNRNLLAFEGNLERVVMNRLVGLVETEARIARAIPMTRPADVEFVWTWPKPPFVDPQKEAGAHKIQLETSTTTVGDILGEKGKTVDQHLKKLEREKKAFESAGIEYPSFSSNQGSEAENRAAIESIVDEAVENLEAVKG